MFTAMFPTSPTKNLALGTKVLLRCPKFSTPKGPAEKAKEKTKNKVM
jgi:hypothetical protein